MPFEENLIEIWYEAVRAIHASRFQAVLAVTGGGSRAISALLSEPGASRTVLEARVPYALPALVEWLGGEPDQACSAETARQMAMAAWKRARQLAPEAAPQTLLGVGCTASLASDRPKRGAHRVHVALQSSVCTESICLTFAKNDAAREAEERHAASLVLSLLGKHCDIDVEPLQATLPAGLQGEQPTSESAQAAPALSELLLGNRDQVVVLSGETDVQAELTGLPPSLALFPGAFHPLHRGHQHMAELAEQRIARPVVWELSIANVDKPPLDFLSMRERVTTLRASDQRPLLITTAPTFRDKAALQPGCTFVVGVDTIERIAECKYYRDEVDRSAAFAAVAAAGCRFLVFGRVLEGNFRVLSDLELPPALQTLCDEVPAADFREDVSSTELRAEPT